MMRKISFKFLLLAGLVLTMGLSSATFANDDKAKRNKNTGTVAIKTTPSPFPVLIDGVQVGLSGTTDEGALFYLAPGEHKVEVLVPNAAKPWSKMVNVRKGGKECICLKVEERTVKTPCPYSISVSGPDRVQDGDLVTFAAFNAAAASATPLNYVWKVTPSSARITSGLGTPSITVDTTGLGGQTVRAEVDVTDGIYDASCRQRIAATTSVVKLPDPDPILPIRWDGWDATNFDDDKARLDNFAAELQNRPDAQGYIIMYQGTGKIDLRSRKVTVLSNRTLTYMTEQRRIPPNRLQITNWGQRPRTSYELWIIPPGANPPVPR